MEKPTKTLAVIMQRRITGNRWESVQWQPWSILETDEPTGPARMLFEHADAAQWLYPGFPLELHRDEAEGYYLNVSTDSPRIFVLWNMEGEAGVPLQVTASYYEGGRWLDGGQTVDSVPMTPELFAWVGGYVEANYRPEPKKRIRPRSFMHPKDRPQR